MFRCRQIIISAGVSFLLGAAPAGAETLRCQSINGNLNCAGSGGVSCQTVDGKKVCTSGHGDVVQSFGGGQFQGQSVGPSQDRLQEQLQGQPQDDEDLAPDEMPPPKTRLEQRGPSGHRMVLERDGTRLRLQNDWLSVERN
jgi:hypothetical protein